MRQMVKMKMVRIPTSKMRVNRRRQVQCEVWGQWWIGLLDWVEFLLEIVIYSNKRCCNWIILQLLIFVICNSNWLGCQLQFFAINLSSPLPMIYLILVGRIFGVPTPIHWSLPPHQPFSSSFSMGNQNVVDCWVVFPSYHHQFPWWWWCEGKKHDLSSRDAHKWSNRCTEQCRSFILGAGSWRPFWFDHIFCSMIFGQVMAKIRHGGRSRTVAFRPFSEVVRCGVFGGDKRVKSY